MKELIENFNMTVCGQYTTTRLNIKVYKEDPTRYCSPRYLFEYTNLDNGSKWDMCQDSVSKYFPQERYINYGRNYPMIYEYQANYYDRSMPLYDHSIEREWHPSEAPQKLLDGAFTLGVVR